MPETTGTYFLCVPLILFFLRPQLRYEDNVLSLQGHGVDGGHSAGAVRRQFHGEGQEIVRAHYAAADGQGTATFAAATAGFGKGESHATASASGNFAL